MRRVQGEAPRPSPDAAVATPGGRAPAGAGAWSGPAPTGQAQEGFVAAVRRRWRRAWPSAAVLVGALLWWPAGFWGLERWPRLPLAITDADVLLLSGAAGAAVVGALVRSPWPRLAIVVALSGIAWLLSPPAGDAVPYERWGLVTVLVVAGLVGLGIGSRASGGPQALGTVLALIAALSQATWPRGLALATALALPFLVATRERVAPTLFSVARLLLAWLVASVLALALRYGWDALRSGSTELTALRNVGEASWDFVRTQWSNAAAAVLQSNVQWFWVALALAIVIVTLRTLRGMGDPAREDGPPRSR